MIGSTIIKKNRNIFEFVLLVKLDILRIWDYIPRKRTILQLLNVSTNPIDIVTIKGTDPFIFNFDEKRTKIDVLIKASRIFSRFQITMGYRQAEPYMDKHRSYRSRDSSNQRLISRLLQETIISF